MSTYLVLYNHSMIYIAGANEVISSSDLKRSFLEVGFNTGNMAIARGVSDLVKTNLSMDSQRFAEGCHISPEDVLVIGAANWISTSVDLSWLMTPSLEKFSKVIVLGLGIQNAVNDISGVSETAKQFLDFLSRKNAVVCTRDKLTQSILGSYLKKIYWTGCPALRINSTPLVVDKVSDSIAYGGSLEVIGHAKNVPLLAKFESTVLEGLSSPRIMSYILQAEYPIMEALSLGKYQQIKDYISSRFGIDDKKLDTSKFNYFFSINEWLNSLASVDYFVGTRLHGNILAWKAGARPFLISHDVRTHAFLEDFKFPGYELTEDKTIEQVLEYSEKFNFEQFEEIFELTGKNLQNAFLAI